MQLDEALVGEVASELARLALRSVSRVYQTVDDDGPISIPQIERIVARSFPSEWSIDRRSAIEMALKAGARSLEGNCGKLSLNHAAHFLFNLDGGPDVPELEKMPPEFIRGAKKDNEKEYDYLRRRLIERADISHYSHASIGRRLREVRAKLATALVDPNFPRTSPSVERHNKGELRLWAGIANVTRGDTAYSKSVTAWVDDVLKIQMTYESAAAAKALRDFTPRFELPTERGRDHRVVVSGVALGEHFAEAAVTVTTQARATLVYVPGTAKLRRNTAMSSDKPTYGTELISDAITGPHGLPVENVLPGRNHRATITILARVVSDQISVRLVGKSDLTKTWRQDIATRQSGTARLRLEIRNRGNRPLKSMFVYCNIPEGATLVPGSVSMTKANGDAEPLPDDLVRPSDPTGQMRHPDAEDGLSIGLLPVGETIYVDCEIRIEQSVKMGSIVTVVGVVRPLGMNEFYNTIKIVVQR